MMSQTIQQLQAILIQNVKNKLKYNAKLTWNGDLGSIQVVSFINIFAETVDRLSSGYSNYYKIQYEVKKIVIVEVLNKNPHVKFDFEKMNEKEGMQFLMELNNFNIGKMNYMESSFQEYLRSLIVDANHEYLSN